MFRHDKLEMLLPFDELDELAQGQIFDALEKPFLKKLAIMPDAHAGYDLCIGGVALLDGVISPGYVGVDIGCGMTNVVTYMPAKEITETGKREIFKRLYQTIPSGNGPGGVWKNFQVYEPFVCSIDGLTFGKGKGKKDRFSVQDFVNERVNTQIGTLGGGNHFIEIGKNKDGYVAITIHSGSRAVGYTIADAYTELSLKNEVAGFAGFFELDSELGQAYNRDRMYAEAFALENRKRMIHSVIEVVFGTIGMIPLVDIPMINENHNHAVVSTDGVLHRKGATPAEVGQMGVIPGNMRDGTYLTVGRGNEQYLSSASHGAGRVMGRREAMRKLDLDDFVDTMDGIVAKVEKSTLDEAPDAYKNFETVISRQDGIVVDVVDSITPIINMKA